MNHVVEYANGTVENVNKDEIKKLLAPLKPNDGVVTRFYEEDPTLWVVEHRCVQHANSGSTWIFGIRQLRKPKNNFILDVNLKFPPSRHDSLGAKRDSRTGQ